MEGVHVVGAWPGGLWGRKSPSWVQGQSKNMKLVYNF